MKLFEVFDGIRGSEAFITVFITQTLKRVFRAQNWPSLGLPVVTCTQYTPNCLQLKSTLSRLSK